MGTVKVEIDLKMPEGFEFVRYDYAKLGEHYLTEPTSECSKIASTDHVEVNGFPKTFIIRPKRWRATPGWNYWKIRMDSKKFYADVDVEEGNDLNDMDYEEHNYFKSKEEVNIYIHHFMTLLKTRSLG